MNNKSCLALFFDADVLDWIETEAERRGESQSSVVQNALREVMDGKLAKATDRAEEAEAEAIRLQGLMADDSALMFMGDE